MIKADVHKNIFRKALLSRFAEEALLDQFSKGGLYGTIHTCIGQELVGSIISEFLILGDTTVSNHRCHGHFLSITDDLDGLIAEIMGRESGVSQGIGGSQHLFKDGFFSNGIQGGMTPIAAGMALAHKILKKGNICTLFIGDGTFGEGVVYETLNIISKWQLPILIVVEDNKYSQSTSQHEVLAGTIAGRANAFDIESAVVNTWDWEEFYLIAEKFIGDIRLSGGPRLLQVETYRLMAHSKGDDIRSEDEVQSFSVKDPLNIFLRSLSGEEKLLIDGIRSRVDTSIERAKNSSYLDISTRITNKNSEKLTHLNWAPQDKGEKKRFVQSLNEALISLMSEHQQILFLGEDIRSPYGGAFKVTKNLSDEFGTRVFNTPISEAAIVGVGSGLGLMGFSPIVEIMFGDFLTLAFDQLMNHAAKFNHMYSNQISTNLIVRTPMGGGRGYGPTHSQSIEKHFFGIPGLRVFALNKFLDPQKIFKVILKDAEGPALVIENKLMYAQYINDFAYIGFDIYESQKTIPDILIRPQSEYVDLTIIGYGGTDGLIANACESLFNNYDQVSQGLIVTQLYPFNIKDYIDLLPNGSAILIVEEGQGFAGFGAEVISQLYEQFPNNQFRVERVNSKAYCIPSSQPLERECLVGVEDIIEAAKNILKIT